MKTGSYELAKSFMKLKDKTLARKCLLQVKKAMKQYHDTQKKMFGSIFS